MLYQTKYYLCEKINNHKIILGNTQTGHGIVLKGNVQEVIVSTETKIWNEDIDSNIKRVLFHTEFLLDSDQIQSQNNLIEKMRVETVFDDSYMSLTIVSTDTYNFNYIYCYY